jgi:ribosomal protein L29
MDKDTTFFILKDIKNDVKLLDEKWESYLKEEGVRKATTKQLSDEIVQLRKVVQVGNGQPSLLVQMAEVKKDLAEIKTMNREQHACVQEVQDDLHELKARFGVKTPKEVQVERWKTIGKLGAGLLLILPGILAWISTF